MQEEHLSFWMIMAIHHKPLSRTLLSPSRQWSRERGLGRPLQAQGGSPGVPSREAEPLQKCIEAGHQEKVTSCRDFLRKKKKVSGVLF